jgi:dipeptidyl aminopeptidase/acylaminoacyl peptidase
MDPESGELSGVPVPIAEGVTLNSNFFSANFSAGGPVLVFRTGQITGRTQITWFDRAGRRIGSSAEPAEWASLNLSKDDNHLALVRSHPKGTDIWSIDLERNVPTRLTSDSLGNGDPNFSADGRTIFFSSVQRGSSEIFRKPASGIGEPQLVAATGRLSDVSRDGRLLLQLRVAEGLAAISLPDGKSTTFLGATNSAVDEARFSPDSKWVAFNRNETDREEVYVVSYPGSEQRWQVSVGGGVQPRWRQDGRELFYLSPDATMMSVGVEEHAGGLRFTRPQPLFATGSRARSFTEDYDVTANGQRFVVLQPAADNEPPAPATAIVNWQSIVRGATQ